MFTFEHKGRTIVVEDASGHSDDIECSISFEDAPDELVPHEIYNIVYNDYSDRLYDDWLENNIREADFMEQYDDGADA